MATITLSSKYQITIPAEMVRDLGLKPGQKLVAELIDGRIVLLPRPESWTSYFAGSMRGSWGTREEIDRYVSEERRSPERGEWLERFDDLVTTDQDVRSVMEVLRSCQPTAASPNEIERRLHNLGLEVRAVGVRSALEKLVKHGGVRRILLGGERLGSETEVYRLVHEVLDR